MAILNINNMIPIPEELITELDYKDVEKYKKFENEKKREDYINLLRKELHLIRSLSPTILANAEYLYDHNKDYPNDNLSKRCCNFVLLEQAMIQYLKIRQEVARTIQNNS